MRDWLIKKQFLNKLYNDELKRNLDIQLGTLWGRHIHTKEEEYDPYKIQLTDMVNIAERLEESMVKAGGGMDLAAGTTPRGGGRNRGRGGRGGGRGGNNGGRQTDPGVQRIPLYPPKTPGKKDKIFQGKLNGKCCSCGKAPHGEDGVSNTAEDRKKKCPARDKNCDNCGKLGHLKSMCQTKAQGNTPKTPRQGNAMKLLYFTIQGVNSAL